MTIVFISIIILLGVISVYLFLENRKSKEELQKVAKINFELDFVLQQERKANEVKVAEITKIREEFSKEFENISNRVIKMQKVDFDREQKQALSVVLNPFQNQIKDFREVIEKTNLMNQSEKGYLKKELDDLKNMNTNLSKNADDLVNALKGNSKIQGDWGEQQLKTILDMAGMVEGIDYQMQFNISTEEGKNLRPDCVINIPQGRKLIVDSKVSITNYIDFVKEEGAESKKRHLALHLSSIKKHIVDLSSKNYHKLLNDNSLDFVFMFIPNEAAYLEALKCDGCIYDNAYKANIMITTPSSILPILRTVRNLWNIEKQNQNVSIIAEKAGKLYDKLAGFVDNMKRIDKSLGGARTAYDDAFNQLSDGRGSALAIAEDMKDLGAKTVKQIKASVKTDDTKLFLDNEGDE